MKRIFTFIVLLFAGWAFINAEVITVYTTVDGYYNGDIVRTQAYSRLFNETQPPVYRFDMFFFTIENSDLTPEDLVKAEFVFVSVLENGITAGISRRLFDATVTAWEADDTWQMNAPLPDPFFVRTISNPVYFPAMGPNPYEGSEEEVTDRSYIDAYETPVRIDITDFFKEMMEGAPYETFSIALTKAYLEPGEEFTRIGYGKDANEAYRPRIELTIGGTGISTPEASPLKIWEENGVISVQGEAGNYTIYSITGQIIESANFFAGKNSFASKLNTGIYIVTCQNNEKTFASKICVK